MSSVESSLGPTLRRLREGQGLSLRELEQRTGLSNGYLSLLENNKVKQPKPQALFALSNGLGIAYSELMRLAGYTPVGDQQDATRADRPAVAFKGAEKLTEVQQQEVQEFINFKLQQMLRARRQGGQE